MEETAVASNGGYNKRPLWQWLAIYVILGAIIYGAIYYFFQGKSGYSYPSPSQVVPSVRVMSNEVTVTLKPIKDSNEAGTAILKEEKGQTKITINLTGYTKDVKQPAHIHLGSCPGVGAVKYPLTSIVNGASTTMLSVTLDQLKKELPLAINVHKSTTEISTYTSCGLLNIQ